MERTFYARTDSNSANNPALNLTGDPATEITFVSQTAGGAAGDLQLDTNGGAPDPDTMVEIGGTLYSFTFEVAGTLPTAKNDGAGQVPDQFEGDPIYIVTVLDYPAPGDTTRLAFLPASGASEADMNAFGKGAVSIQSLGTTPTTPICFAAGTRIATPGGAVAVEALGPGDRVLTASGAVRGILWAGATAFAWPGADDRHKPVLIGAGTLGPGRPRHDLVVSPQHRILLDGATVRRVTGHAAVLAPALGLTGLAGIRRMQGRRQVTYHHLLLPAHDILLAEGLAAESLYPGPMALAALDPAARTDLLRRLPDPAAYGPPCAPVLGRRAAEALVRALAARPDDRRPLAA